MEKEIKIRKMILDKEIELLHVILSGAKDEVKLQEITITISFLKRLLYTN